MNKRSNKNYFRLDIKSNKVVKGINLEGVRQVGEPEIFSRKILQAGSR